MSTDTKKNILVNFGLIAVVAVIIVGFFAWLTLGNLQESIPGVGQIVPEGRIRRVMAPFTGVVASVQVDENDYVKKGQVIAILDPEVTEIEQQSGMLQHRLLEEEAIALESAYRGGRNPISHASVSAAWLDASRDALNAKLDQASLTVHEKEHDLNQALARYEENKKILASSEKLLEQYTKLFEEGGVAQNEVINYEQKVLDRRGQIAQLEEEIQSRRVELSKFKTVARELSNNYKQDVLSRLKTVQQELALNEGNLAKSSVALKRQVIRAPIDGVVHQQVIRGSGDVVREGDVMLTVVPEGSSMLAEVKVTNKDLAYIHLNQRASLLLDAFPYQRFGKLYGKVMAISPSSMEDDEGNTFYVVRIKPDQFYLESKDGERHNLRSGMTVTADIITRDKNILSIFTEPLQLKLDRAFRDPSTRV